MAARFLVALKVIVLCFSALTVWAQTPNPALVGEWSSLNDWPTVAIHSQLLPGGKVMFWPGNGGTGDDPRLWDPATDSVISLNKAGFDMFCVGHNFLADGRLFVAGGHNGANYFGLPNASIYDAATNVWTRLPDMNAGRWYPTLTTLTNGDILVVSGDIDGSNDINPLPQVWQTSAGTWRNLTNAQLVQDLYPWMHVAPNGLVFNSGPGATTRYLDPSGSGAWTSLGDRQFAVSRDYGSSVMYADGKIIVMGGHEDPPTSTAEVIDLNAPSPTWRFVASMAFPRRHMNATLLPDGKVLVTGGTTGPGFDDETLANAVLAAEMWDPATETWTTMSSMSTNRSYHSMALLLPDGRVLSYGGVDPTQTQYLKTEVFSPPYLFKGAPPAIGSAPANVVYGQTFFVGTPDATSVTAANWIRMPVVTHAFNQNQRINRLSFTRTTGGLNIVAPSNRNLTPPGHYMLFLLNSNGVPSIASIIHIDGTQPPNQPPTVSLTSPANGAVFTAPATITLNATASDPDGTVTKVDFTTGTTFLGTATTAPYSFTWSNVAAGTYSLNATAYDNSGTATTSAPVTITVNGSGTATPPLALLHLNEPAGSSTFADASGNGNTGTCSGTSCPTAGVPGKINTAVQFDGTADFVTLNSTSLQTVTNGSFSLEAWVSPQNLPPTACSTNSNTCGYGVLMKPGYHEGLVYSVSGQYSADIWNAAGQKFTMIGPVVQPGAFHHVAMVVDDGSKRLHLYVDGQEVAGSPITYSGTLMSYGANPFYIGTGNPTATDWRWMFNGVIDEVGIYGSALSSQEVLNHFNGTSGPPPPNQKPTVTMTAPSSGSVFTAPATITLSASASDPNGTITSVTFNAGETALGTVTTAPYSFTWNNVPAGSYALTATARDNNGAAATSTIVNITVTTAGSPTPALASLHLDEPAGSSTFADASGNGNIGTCSGASCPTAGIAGRINTALQFDGVADFATLNSTSLQTVTNGSFSLEAWVSPQSLPPTTCAANSNTCSYGVVIKTGFHSGIVYNNVGQYSGDIWNSSNQKFTVIGPVVQPGAFHHVAMTVDDTAKQLHLYLDGQEVAGSPIIYSGTLKTYGTAPFYLGTGNPTATSWQWMFKGVMDEVGIYGSALSAQDVLNHFNGGGSTNQPPTVSLTGPANGATFTAPATITLTANASDADGTVAKVDFKSGGQIIGTDTSAPYSFTWSNVPAGTYTLTATATDNANAATTSTAITVTVNGTTTGTQALASLHLDEPAGSTTFADASGNGNVGTCTGTACPTAGVAGKINTALQFDGVADFATLNSASLQTATNGSFTLSAWVAPQVLPPTSCSSNTNTCSYGILMKPGYHAGLVYQQSGQYSADIWNASNQKFTVLSPAITPGSYHHVAMVVDDTAKQLHLYVDGQEVSGSPLAYTGTLKNYGTAPFYLGTGNPTATSWRWMFQGSLDEVRIYNSALSSQNVLNDFNGSGGPPTNQPPTVSLTSPANGATFTAPANIPVSANASDSDGTIAKVEFKSGGQIIGTDTASPYSFTWSNVPAGTYTLTATATDNANAATTSSAVTITVNGTGSAPQALASLHLDEPAGSSTFADASGNGNIGTCSGASCPTAGVAGKTNTALQFDGVADFVTVDSGSLQNVTDSSFSLAAWVSPQSLPTTTCSVNTNTCSYGIVMKPGYHSGLVYNNAGQYSADIWNAANQKFTVLSPVVTPSAFHHLAMTVDDTAKQLHLYLDGQEVPGSPIVYSGTLRDFGTNPFYLGTGNPTASDWRWMFKGVIDDVRIYAHALSGQDVLSVFSGQ